MSEFRSSSMVRLIQWILIKNGFTADQARVAIEKLRSEITEVASQKEDDEVPLALSQRLARYITRLQLRDGVSYDAFETRYQHNYQILLQLLTGIPVGLLTGLLLNELQKPSDDTTHLRSEFYYEIGNVYLREGALDRAIEEYGRAIGLSELC